MGVMDLVGKEEPWEHEQEEERRGQRRETLTIPRCEMSMEMPEEEQPEKFRERIVSRAENYSKVQEAGDCDGPGLRHCRKVV